MPRRLRIIAMIRQLMSIMPDWMSWDDIQELFQFFLGLLPLPTWSDSEATRVWALKALGFADELAEKTATEIDDMAVNALQVLAENQTAWASLHALIMDLFGEDAGVVSEDDPRVVKAADDSKIDPSIIVLIINAIMELFRWWRNRGVEAGSPTTENND